MKSNLHWPYTHVWGPYILRNLFKCQWSLKLFSPFSCIFLFSSKYIVRYSGVYSWEKCGIQMRGMWNLRAWWPYILAVSPHSLLLCTVCSFNLKCSFCPNCFFFQKERTLSCIHHPSLKTVVFDCFSTRLCGAHTLEMFPPCPISYASVIILILTCMSWGCFWIYFLQEALYDE